MSYPYTGIQGYFEKGVENTEGIYTEEKRLGVGVTGPSGALHVMGETGIYAFISEIGGIAVNTPDDMNTYYNKVDGNNWNYFQFKKNGQPKWAIGVDSNHNFFMGNYNTSFDPSILIDINRTLINLRYNLLAQSANFTGNINCAGVINAAGFTGPSLNFTGSTGSTGIQGIQGLTGIAGVDGSQGDRGSTGFPGPQGATGSKGETGVSLPGFTGLQGPTGFMGPTGIQGETGLRGFNGSQGDTGIHGPLGPVGFTGPQGIKGDPGATGVRGSTGAIGVTGIDGVIGPQGVTGLQGIDGEVGATGVRGFAGSTGLGITGPQGITGIGAIYSRTTHTQSTSTISNGATENITINGAKGYVLYKIYTSAAAWVRLYTSTSSRASDSSRSEGTDPLPGSGVVAEVITSGATTVLITPSTIGFTEDESSSIPVAVTNKSGSSTSIDVTLTLVRIEQ